MEPHPQHEADAKSDSASGDTVREDVQLDNPGQPESTDAYPILPADLGDVPGVYRLLKHYSDRGILLPRPESDIYHSLREFSVVHHEGEVIACCALQIFTHTLGEVRSLAVSPSFADRGIGRRLVATIEQQAVDIGLSKLMALTYEVRFFNKSGYEIVEMSVLPEKVWGACINCHKFRNCDEIAVLKNLMSSSIQADPGINQPSPQGEHS